MDSNHEVLIATLQKLLRGGIAHVGLADSLKNLPKSARGEKIDKLPYSIWQLLSHIKIAQWDMLEFCRNPNHKSPKWPEEYWPKDAEPKTDALWNETIKQIDDDLEDFIYFLKESDIYEEVSGGTGQTILLEAMQIADHNAYHVGEIVMMRRLQGNWKN